MNYLTHYYKNLSEQLECKYRELISELAQAMPTELTVEPVEQEMSAMGPPARGTGKPGQPKPNQPNQPNQGDGWNTPPQPPADPGPQPQRGQPPAPTSETEEQYRRRFEEWSRQKSIYDTYRSICPSGNCTGPDGRPIRIFYWPNPPHPSAPGYGTGGPGNINPYLRDGDIWIDQRGRPLVWSTTPNDVNPKFRPYTPPAQKPAGTQGTGNNTTPRRNNQNGLQVEQKINKILKPITEAQDPLYGARPYYGEPGGIGRLSRNNGWPGWPQAQKPPWWDEYVREWNSQYPEPPYDQPVGPHHIYPVRPLDPSWQSPIGGPQYKPGFPGGPRKPKPGQNDTIPDAFQQPTIPISVPGVDPGIFGPPSPGTQALQSGSSTNYY